MLPTGTAECYGVSLLHYQVRERKGGLRARGATAVGDGMYGTGAPSFSARFADFRASLKPINRTIWVVYANVALYALCYQMQVRAAAEDT